MTLDDLGRIYDDAYENRARLEFPTPEMKRAMHRAGIRAVVAALRDEFEAVALNCGASPAVAGRCADKAINEILASDGVKSEGSE